MQIEQLQIILGGLALALVVLILFALRRRLPVPKLPRIALPKIRRISKASKAGDEPEAQLSSKRLARLKLDMATEPEAANPDEAVPETIPAGASGEQSPADFAASIERRLEEGFNLFEAGSIDMAEYRLRLGEIDATVAAAEANSQADTEVRDPDQVMRAREAVEWCKQWAAEFDPAPKVS